MTSDAQLSPLDGTPLKTVAWRFLGMRIGQRVFDDGCVIIERTMVAIGDDCALNYGSRIQPHSQEDFGFKSDRIAIGAGCTLSVGAWVHYGVKMGDGSQLAPNAFLNEGRGRATVHPVGRQSSQGTRTKLRGGSDCVIVASTRAIDTSEMPMEQESHA